MENNVSLHIFLLRDIKRACRGFLRYDPEKITHITSLLSNQTWDMNLYKLNCTYCIPEDGQECPHKQNSELCKTAGGKGVTFQVLYILQRFRFTPHVQNSLIC